MVYYCRIQGSNKRVTYGFDPNGGKMVLWRDTHGQVTCMSDICPHHGAALSVGKLLGDGPVHRLISLEGEKLIQGDGPIIEYRRRRQELIEAAQK